MYCDINGTHFHMLAKIEIKQNDIQNIIMENFEAISSNSLICIFKFMFREMFYEKVQNFHNFLFLCWIFIKFHSSICIFSLLKSTQI